MMRPPKSIVTSVKTPVAIEQQEEQLASEEKVVEKKKEIKPVELKKENKVEATNAPKFQNKL